MFVPRTISDNILAVYHTKQSKDVSRLIKSEDFTYWTKKHVKTLKKICLDTIMINWEEYQIINKFVLDEDARYVLDNLPSDIPFKLGVSHIHDDLYWRRAFKSRWAGKMLPMRPVKLDYDIPNQYDRSKMNKLNNDENYFENIIKLNTWKCFYVERHLQDFLEHLRPENYNSEEMKELIELSRDYIIRLKLNQLQAPAVHDKERIPLQTILPALMNLKELNICFKQTYVGDDFSWHVLQTTQRDIENLGRGLEKCDLRVLRIINTDITCAKVAILAGNLSTNKSLRVLDFSHCKIGDQGVAALCELLEKLPTLQELNLMNNFIGSKGLEYLCETLSRPSIKLDQLHLNLNKFGPSGADFLSKMLEENTQLTGLNLSACGLTTDNVELLITALKTNTSLMHFDLSNNSLNEGTGNSIIRLLKTFNFKLRTIDLRMTRIPSKIVLIIEEILDDRQRKSRDGKQFTSYRDSTKENDAADDIKVTVRETKESDSANCNEREFGQENKVESKAFPQFRTVEELEAHVANVSRVYIDGLRQELKICCDKYIDGGGEEECIDD